MTFRWNNLSGGDFIPCKTGHSQSWFEVTGTASNFIGVNIVELCVSLQQWHEAISSTSAL